MRARMGRGQAKTAAQQSQVAERVGITRKLEAPKKASPTCRGWGGGLRAQAQGLCLLSCSWSVSKARSSKLEQPGGELSLVPTQGKLELTAQEINAIFQHHGRLVGQ